MLSHVRKQDVLLVRLTGELDQCSASGIRRDLDTLISDPRVRHLVIGLNDMPFMDSSGLGVILGRYRTMQVRGGTVALMHLLPQVKRVYDLSGLARIIPVIGEEKAQG